MNGSASLYSVVHNWAESITLRFVQVCTCTLHVYNVIPF